MFKYGGLYRLEVFIVFRSVVRGVSAFYRAFFSIVVGYVVGVVFLFRLFGFFSWRFGFSGVF